MPQLIDDDQGIRIAIALVLAIVVILSQHLVGDSRHSYIKSMKYKRFKFDLNQIFLKRLRRIMRFNKKEIRLLINYFVIDTIK
jgi:hypothetical protein